jgi:hypothetical protein
VQREIKFTISSNGEVESEFAGFHGEDCLEEAENLKAALRSLGLRITGHKIVMKSQEQIASEIGEDTRSERHKRARVGHEN